MTGSFSKLMSKGYNLISPEKVKIFSGEQTQSENFLFDEFTDTSIVCWFKMKEMYTEKEVYVPTCIILMYYVSPIKNEARIGYATSGGLTSHFTPNLGTEHGLLEIIERHEINLSWYCFIAPKKIVIDNITNKKLAKYLDYINQNEITFYRHNVDQENFHVVTAMSFDEDLTSYSFNAGGGIDCDI
ncbi:MAG: YcaO-like family protein [Oscillospiraceae bacterium]